MTNPIIQLTDISASYDEKTVLSHVNLTVYERDFLGVIGPNGGGKTTLIKIILGLLKPASGSVRFYKNEKEVAAAELKVQELDTYHNTTVLTRNSPSPYMRWYYRGSTNRNPCSTATPPNSTNW